jgi:hypothetical protein
MVTRLHALEPLLYTDEERLHTEFVARFYELITQSIQPPYAISIDGLWGAGKTTIMRRLHEKLDNAGYPVFWYNPWKYRQTESVVLAFFQSLYLASADKQYLADMNKNGTTILRVLLESGVDAGLKLITQGAFSWKETTSPFTLVEAARPVSCLDYHYAIKTIQQEFVELILAVSRHHEHKPVIMFIDDLDRCLPADMLYFLEALKNLFTTSGCRAIFICGIDTQIAKQFIAKYYPRAGKTYAISYLRKIFPITLSMPYSANIKRVLVQSIKDLYGWDHHEAHKAESLARMVYTLGLQTQISSVRKYLNIVANVYTVMKCNPTYTFQADHDFITKLLILKEAWQPLYETLIRKALREQSNMEQLIQSVIEQEELLEEQERFLTAYLGKDTPFAKEQLSTWLARHPTLV